MTDNIDIKEEIYKCSKCGLCKSVCPVYLATKNEMFLSRGRFIVLNNFFNNGGDLNKDFIHNLDICLNCNACKNFCPSNIDTYRILTTLKSNHGYKYSFLSFSSIYKILLYGIRFIGWIYKYLPFKSLFLNSYTDKLFTKQVIRDRNNTPDIIKGNIVFFEGCVNKYINNSDKNASLNLIEESGYKIKKVISECCGYPYLCEGNFKKFTKGINKIINSVPNDIQYIVCSCDTCYDTLKKFSQYCDKAKDFEQKVIRLDEFLKINGINISAKENTIYFKPLLRTEECYLPQNVQLKEDKKGLCSTYENFFALKYPNYANEIINNQFYKKEEIDNKIIITSCQLAKLGILSAIKRIGSNAEVMTYSEYMAKQK